MQPRQGPPGVAGGTGRAAKAWAAAKAVAAACVLVLGASSLAGCAQKASAAASIELGTAYVEVPSTGDVTGGYLVIRNNGTSDRLIAARTSVGGRVTFRAPAHLGSTTMRTVPDITIPADTLLRLSPDSSHLLITGARPMKGGTQITLTLVFAKGGTMSVVAAVTNPESGGSSYFLN
jgi:copper(I)-binding protein